MIRFLRFKVTASLLVSLLGVSSASADFSINDEFVCSIDKVVSSTTGQDETVAALASAGKAVKKFERKVARLRGKKRAEAQRHLVAAQALKKDLRFCAKGYFKLPILYPGAFHFLTYQPFHGEYSGSLGPEDIGGNADAAFALDGTVFSATISFTSGELQAAIPPIHFSKDLADDLGRSDLLSEHSTLGPLKLVLSSQLPNIKISPQYPATGSDFRLTGYEAGGIFWVKFSGTLNGVPFSGKMNLAFF